MKRRIQAFFVMLMIITTLCIGCFGCSSNSSNEKITIKYFCPTINLPDADDAIIEYLENKFDVNIQLSGVAWDDYEDSLNMRLSGNETPDVFSVLNEKKSSFMMKITNSGKATRLSDYLVSGKYPNIEAYLDAHPEIAKLYGEVDGTTFGIPPYCGELPQAIIIRKDWLDRLNLEVPTSYEEFRETLQAFVENDLDNTGCSGLAIPDIWYVMNIITAYTGVNGFSFWEKSNGKWIYQCEMDGFIDSIRYVHDLYEGGLIEPQYSVTQEAEAAEMFINGKVGATFFTPSLENYNQIVNGVKEKYPNANCEFIIPYMYSDLGNAWIRNYGFYSVMMISSDASAEKIDKILSIMDWSLSDEGIKICTYGIEGTHFNIDSNGKMSIIEQTTSRDLPNNRSYATQLGLDQSTPISLLPESISRLQEESVKDGITDKLTIQIPSTNIEDLDAMANLDDAIFEVYERYIQGFIIGTKDIDADWNDFMLELDNAGLTKYREFLQKYGDYMN